jgi:hypothetical protein
MVLEDGRSRSRHKKDPPKRAGYAPGKSTMDIFRQPNALLFTDHDRDDHDRDRCGA